MTREEALKKIKAEIQMYDEESLESIEWEECYEALEQEPKTDLRECGSCKYSKDGHMAGTEECHGCMWKNKQEPCEDAWIIDSFKEFLGESYGALTSNKKEFIAWLERLRWHVVRCDELAIELKNYKKQTECEDAISRQDTLKTIIKHLGIRSEVYLLPAEEAIYKVVKNMPPVTPQPKTGHWIYDEVLDKNYYCSECKSMGVDYWDYCPYCGARMIEPQESEES